MEVYVPIGHTNTRKSSIVRALTGASSATLRANQLVWFVTFGHQTRSAFVLTSALQESGVTADDLRVAFKSSGADTAIFPLRRDARLFDGRPMESAQSYVSRFAKSFRWKVHAAYMAGGAPLVDVSSDLAVPIARADGTNALAARLRTKWGIT